MGILFALGSALIFVLGFPTLWYFVAFALVLGAGIAGFLRISSSDRANRNKPLSILITAEKTDRHAVPRQKWQKLFQISAESFTA